MRIFQSLKKEFFHVFPLFLFFLVCFTIINQIEFFLFERAGITPANFLEIALAAGLIAKIVLAIDHLPFINLFSKRPLIITIIWKSMNYWVCLFITRILIRFVPYALSAKSGLITDMHLFEAHFDWHLFWAVQVFYLMFLFIYVSFSELTHKIGDKKMKQILFGIKKTISN
jgi:hypothetical protein